MFGLPDITFVSVACALAVCFGLLIWWGLHFRGDDPDV
jgi:hypothetical protein